MEEEFKVNIDKALEERRSVAKETENKDKFITSSEMRDQAEKDFKKYSTKKVLIARRGTFQTYQKWTFNILQFDIKITPLKDR